MLADCSDDDSGLISLPSTEDMTPRQGFAAAASGLRTRSFCSGGSLGAAAFGMTPVFRTTIVTVVGRLSQNEITSSQTSRMEIEVYLGGRLHFPTVFEI